MRNDTKNNENNKPIIEVRNIGKKYDIAHMRGGYVALRDVIANIVRSPFSFLKDKAERAVGLKKKEEFWALKDVSFNINQGEVVGIIGANGAGKSTLLKILSQITPPTEGEIILRGRVGSLLEVGTGFHPELTGRENIFLNGAILGMKKREIEKKFDEIVEFAGIGKFLDTPVKRYSSGMYVRLAFAVAAHMDPDILLIDEVLAVGDAEFQKKCLGKMDDITKREGRTILFVSHNLSAIQRLCNKSILIDKGSVVVFGDTEEVIKIYLEKSSSQSQQSVSTRKDRQGNGELKITDCYIETEQNQRTENVNSGDKIRIVFEYECNQNSELNEVVIATNLESQNGESVTLLHTEMVREPFQEISGKGKFICVIKKLPLVSGTYGITARITSAGNLLDYITNIKKFEVVPGDYFNNGKVINHSLVYTEHSWLKE